MRISDWSSDVCSSDLQMFDYFPRLKERRNNKAGSISGGEQEMLTMCRSLLGNPLVMLIDEPTEGLGPKTAQVVGDGIREINSEGGPVVLVGPKLAIGLVEWSGREAWRERVSRKVRLSMG